MNSRISGTDPLSPDSGNIVITEDDNSTATVIVCDGGDIEMDVDADGTTDGWFFTSFDELF